MNSLVNKFLIGLAGLAIATVPLAASAQSYHNDDRGSYQRNDNRGHADNRRDNQRGDYQRGDSRYRGDDSRQDGGSYANGYYGYAPGGFQGYYSNGGWYHHRRWNAGVWLYF
jgi:Ni/Co efflux regulator RcnB